MRRTVVEHPTDPLIHQLVTERYRLTRLRMTDCSPTPPSAPTAPIYALCKLNAARRTIGKQLTEALPSLDQGIQGSAARKEADAGEKGCAQALVILLRRSGPPCS